MRTLNDNLMEDRSVAYNLMVNIGFDNDRPDMEFRYFVCKALYDVLCWILRKQEKS